MPCAFQAKRLAQVVKERENAIIEADVDRLAEAIRPFGVVAAHEGVEVHGAQIGRFDPREDSRKNIPPGCA